MLQGMTAQYLLRRTYRVKAGDTILIHAAAGGVGMIACQWAKALGATVIGTVGSDEKAELAKAHGCDHPIVYTREDFTKRVREITNGAGVPVVYDSIGKETYTASLDCLAPLGLFVSFGNTSGPLPPIDSSEFAGRGSLYFTRPRSQYIAKRATTRRCPRAVRRMVSGKVKASINQLRVGRCRAAHADLAPPPVHGSAAVNAKDRKPIPSGQGRSPRERPFRFTRFLQPSPSLTSPLRGSA